MTTKDQQYIDEKSDNRNFAILENSLDLLSKFGLSPNQSKVYLSLCKDGPKTASFLSDTLGIPRTEVYHLLKNLKQKGCVAVINQKPLKFRSISIDIFFERTIDNEKNKITKLEEILTQIRKIKSTSKVKDKFQNNLIFESH